MRGSRRATSCCSSGKSNGCSEGWGVVALVPCHRGWTFLPPTGSCMISSLWLWDAYRKGFFPPSPFWVYQQKISAAAKLGRWGTQHKEMAHPLTQLVRCCWSFPCEFAQALWEGKFLLSVRFLHPGFLMCSTNSRRCWDTSQRGCCWQAPSAAGPAMERLWVRACGGCAVGVHKKEGEKVKLRAGEPTHCCVSCGSFLSWL